MDSAAAAARNFGQLTNAIPKFCIRNRKKSLERQRKESHHPGNTRSTVLTQLLPRFLKGQ